MLNLPFTPTNASLQRMMSLLLAGILVALLIAGIFATSVEAGPGKQCDPWYNKGGCCNSPWWPGEQDKQERKCWYCWSVGNCTEPWIEKRCKTISTCP